MKKISALLIAVVFCHFAFSQASRMTLVEEFTQASCPPCASQNPAFDDLLLSNAPTVITLKYHTDWPGVDEMNAQNPGDIQTRVTYYSVNGVPTAIMDGFKWPDYDGYTSSADMYPGAPYQCSQDLIDSMSAITSPFTMSLAHFLSVDRDSIYATVTITAASAVSGNLVAQVAVVEKTISFNTPPGTNGETVFDAVAKKMLPSANGTILSSAWNAGDTYSFTVGYKLSDIYDMNQLGVVAFIQNNTGKAILQSAYSEPQQLQDLAVVASLSSSSVITCDGNVTPSLTIQNTGSNTLTSSTISYTVDNGTPATYNWTGSLSSGASSASISLPSLNLAAGSHTITATIADANGIVLGAEILGPSLSITSIGDPTYTPIIEGFVSTTFPPAGWSVNNPDNGDTWVRSSQCGGFQLSNNSTKYAFYMIGDGAVDELYVQNFDLSDASQTIATMKFSLAKAKYTGYNDELKVLASADCGGSWVTLYDKTDNSGLNTATSTSDWKPTTASQWKSESLDLSSFLGNSNVIIKFQAISGYGNNLYIDDINVFYGLEVGIDEAGLSNGISLYPNPANAMTTVQINSTLAANSTIEFLNMLGQKIYAASAKSNSFLQVNTSAWESGMYIYRLVNSDGSILKQDKLNVTH